MESILRQGTTCKYLGFIKVQKIHVKPHGEGDATKFLFSWVLKFECI